MMDSFFAPLLQPVNEQAKYLFQLTELVTTCNKIIMTKNFAMQQTIQNNGNLQYLITVNYQRMMAFEQAAFVTNNKNLRDFYAARAGESEAYLNELSIALNIDESTLCDPRLCNELLKNINAKKTTGSMLQFIISFEKIVISWYKKVIADVKFLPVELAAIINKQHRCVGASASALHEL